VSSSGFVHKTALVESSEIGANTRIWAFSHVLAGARIGSNCNIGDHGFIEGGAVVGNNVTIKNNVCLWDGVTIEDDVFIGPSAVFTNDLYPRSARMPEVQARYADRDSWLEPTIVERGSTIGANATIPPGIRLGAHCMIAAGAIVTKNVKPHALVMGTPARQIGTVCRCGSRLHLEQTSRCAKCGFTLDACGA
jgi:UDP-2-acetamido-3-amino-2,3-dideoxy-glucuronate N-acetyltransferase